MQSYINSYSKYLPVLMLGAVTLLLVGCNSSKPVVENDGIYSSGEVYATEYRAVNDKNDYYQQYFSAKAAEIEEIPEENVIFTDIDAYTTTERLDDDGYVVIEDAYEEEAGYGGWGSNGGNVSVNVYNNGWAGAGWYHPWGFYNNYWGFSPYWGWNSFNWGWGYGFYNPFYCSPFYGGFYNPYYGAGYNPYGYATHYNRGRSNADYLAGRATYNSRGRSNVSSSRSNYSRTEAARRSSLDNSRSSKMIRSSRTYNYSRPAQRPSMNNSRSNNSNSRYNPSNSRPSNSRPSYSRPSSTRSSGSMNRGGGGSSRGGGGRSSGGRGGRG